MNDKYEAAELVVVGRAQDVILGIKDNAVLDNRSGPPPDFQDTMLASFDE